MSIRTFALALMVSLGPAAAAAPDEEALGKGSGYPHARLGPGFSLFDDRYRVGNFTHMEDIFEARRIAASPSPRALCRAPEELRVSYPFEGGTYGIDDLLQRQRIMGLLIVQGDCIVFERYQYGRSARDKFASFSMAKTVTGLLTGIAARDGLIESLDDPAEKYASGLAGTVYGPLAIRTLLRMSSGAEWSDRTSPGRQGDIARLSAETYLRRGSGGASALRGVRPSQAAPGTRFNYSSAESFALGLALRGAVRTDLARYAEDKLWKPMGAESAASWLVDASGMEAAYCCLNATLRDYARLGMLLAADGEVAGTAVVPKDFLLDATDAARQPEYLRPRRATPFFGYGYQAWIYPFRTRTFQARGLFGQELIVQPASKVVIVIASALDGEMPPRTMIERNYFVGAVLKALGGQADVYREPLR